jgi:outer membrane protein, adhesin transport system
MAMLLKTTLLLLSSTLIANAMNLHEVVEQTTSTHPVVIEKVRNYNAVRESLKGSRSEYRPKIDISIGVGLEKVNNSITNFTDQRSNIRQSRLTLNQNLYNGMTSYYTVASEERRLDSAYFTYLEELNAITFETVEVYLELIKQQRLLNLAVQNIDNHASKFSQVRERTDGGAGSQSELDRIAGRLATAQSDHMVQKNAYLDSVFNFQKYYGDFVEARELSLPLFDNGTLPLTLKEAISKMQSYHPSLIIANQNVDVKKMQYESLKGNMRPKVDLSITRAWNENLGGFIGKDNSYQAMVTLNYNIYNGHGDNAKRQSALSEVHVENEKKRNMQRNLMNNLQLSWSEYKLLQKQQKFLKKNAYYMRKVHSSYKKEFALGRRTIVDMLDSEHEVYLADVAVVGNEFSYIRSKFRLLSMMGNLYDVLKSQIPTEFEYKLLNEERYEKFYDDDYLPLERERDHDNVIDTSDMCVNSLKDSLTVGTGCSSEASEKYLYDPAAEVRKEMVQNSVRDEVELKTSTLNLGEKTIFNYITFESKTIQFSKQSELVMREVIEQLKVFSGASIAKITVFSNDYDSEVKNYKISLDRAYYLKKSLLLNGIKGENIDIFASTKYDHKQSAGRYNYFTIEMYDLYEYTKEGVSSIEQDSIVFVKNDIELNSPALIAVKKLAEQFKTMGSVKIEVVNHSGDSDSHRQNEKLSRKRAALIKAILVQAGINEEHVIDIGLGSFERDFEEILDDDESQSKNATEFIIKE